MNAILMRGDARHIPLADSTVDLIVTSPPFYQLRSYTDNGEHYADQIGSEPTPREYIDSLLECTRDWLRVLKPSGSLFVELGDKYVADNRGSGTDVKRGAAKYAPAGPQGFRGRDMARQKSLMLLPHRYAMGCIDELGLILRAEIVWHHVNGLPESVTDRARRAHSVMFHLVKQPRYYAAVDEIREPHLHGTRGMSWAERCDEGFVSCRGPLRGNAWSDRTSGDNTKLGNALGKLPGSVWDIPSQPLTVPPHLGVDHFAAFPMELPRRCVLGWSPPGICVACGEGRRPVVDRTGRIVPSSGSPALGGEGPRYPAHHGGWSRLRTATGWSFPRHEATITGYACACPTPDAPTRPAIVLDPFSGTGTAPLVASALGRIGIGVDRSADYCRLAQWRTTDPGERARALEVPKPPKQLDGQGALWP